MAQLIAQQQAEIERLRAALQQSSAPSSEEKGGGKEEASSKASRKWRVCRRNSSHGGKEDNGRSPLVDLARRKHLTQKEVEGMRNAIATGSAEEEDDDTDLDEEVMEERPLSPAAAETEVVEVTTVLGATESRQRPPVAAPRRRWYGTRIR